MDTSFFAKPLFSASSIAVPDILGTPNESQMQGTLYEKLAELTGRFEYSSFGKGLASKPFHEDIIGKKQYNPYSHVIISGIFSTKDFSTLLQINACLSGISGIVTTLKKEYLIVSFKLSELFTFSNNPPSENKEIWQLEPQVYRALYVAVSRCLPYVHKFLVPPKNNQGSLIFNIIDVNDKNHSWKTLLIGAPTKVITDIICRVNYAAISKRVNSHTDYSRWFAESPVLQELASMDSYLFVNLKQLTDSFKDACIDVFKSVYNNTKNYVATVQVKETLEQNAIARGVANSFVPQGSVEMVIITASVIEWKKMLERISSEIQYDLDIQHLCFNAEDSIQKSLSF